MALFVAVVATNPAVMALVVVANAVWFDPVTVTGSDLTTVTANKGALADTKMGAVARYCAVIAGAGFLVVHALIHVVDELSGPNALGEFTRDFGGVFLPAILAAWIAWPSRSHSAQDDA